MAVVRMSFFPVSPGNGIDADRYHTDVEHWIIEGLNEMYVAGWSTARQRAAGFRSGGSSSARPKRREGEQDGGDEAADG
jgi:hypothetical protein